MHVNRDPGLYVLAGVVCLASSCASIRSTLRTLLDAGQPRLHWSSESPERKEKIVGALAQEPICHIRPCFAPIPGGIWQIDAAAGPSAARDVPGAAPAVS